MPFQATVAAVRKALNDIFAEVDCWFDSPDEVGRFRPGSGGWSIDQVLEHVTLTNHFLMLVIRRRSEKAVRKARRGEVIPEGESDLAALDVIGERGCFGWVRPQHMEPTGVPTSAEVRDRMRRQVAECLDLLARMGNGEGALCKVRMSVNDLGKIDLYQWLYFLAQHARRHLHQMREVQREFGKAPPEPAGPRVKAYAETHREVDRLLLPRVLEYARGNLRRAAQLLGIARQTLRLKLPDLGLSVTRPAGAEDDDPV